MRQAPDGPQSVAAPHPPDPLPDEWERRLARVLTIMPRRLRPLSVWLARGLVGRLLLHTTAGLVRVQIFDRSMTLAAQAFTSIFPLIILFGVVVGPGRSASVADLAHLPDTSRKVIDDALLGRAVPARMLLPGGLAFGIVMLIVRPVGSVYLPRALETSADRYGTIGVAFSYIGWLYVIAFGLLLAVVFGEVVARDEGVLGRFFRHPRPGSPSAKPADPEFMRPG